MSDNLPPFRENGEFRQFKGNSLNQFTNINNNYVSGVAIQAGTRCTHSSFSGDKRERINEAYF